MKHGMLLDYAFGLTGACECWAAEALTALTVPA